MMCQVSCIVFGAKNLTKEEVKGKRVIEVGSCDINGSLRPIIESFEPSEYIGVDIEGGYSVDLICAAEELVEKFGRETFDIVISTEMLEHVRNWRKAITNIKNVCRPEGIILLTTCSYGFPYHAYPHDYWRYEVEDMKILFGDCEIMALERNRQSPGVFIKAKKPKAFCEQILLEYELYSIVVNRRVREIVANDFRSLYFIHLLLKTKLKVFVLKAGKFAFSKI